MDAFVDALDRRGGRRIKVEDSTASDDQLMTDGSVTYGVVQVASDDDEQAQLISGLISNQVILHGLANEDRIPGDSSISEARLAYIPATITGTERRHSLNTVNATPISVSPSAGPLYIMMAPSDVLQSSQQRSIMPRLATSIKTEKVERVSRDDRRRATHNEIERRRRDKISCWILQLGKLIPEFTANQTKQGDIGLQSKSVILSKACEYIVELQNVHRELADRLKDAERCRDELEHLQQSCEELKRENDLFRAHLQERGITEDQF